MQLDILIRMVIRVLVRCFVDASLSRGEVNSCVTLIEVLLIGQPCLRLGRGCPRVAEELRPFNLTSQFHKPQDSRDEEWIRH